LRLLTPDRIYVEELLDAGVGTDADVAKNLADLRRINRLLGGTRVVLKALEADIDKSHPRSISLLDVGTGSADIPASVIAWCKARGASAQVAALDFSERNLRIASARLGVSPEIAFVQADALELPFGDGSFDYLTASLFLHHFRDEEVVRLLADFARVARRAVIVNDLVRNLVPYYFMKITGPLLATSFLTRSDGPVSVLRGFTARELHSLAEAAGLRRFKVERLFPYRLSLVAEPYR
jgi:ubiquinone/menaquinone biosynthesis C-methylase UbiE